MNIWHINVYECDLSEGVDWLRIVYVLVGQDHYSSGKNVLSPETATVSRAIFSSVRQDRTARFDGH